MKGNLKRFFSAALSVLVVLSAIGGLSSFADEDPVYAPVSDTALENWEPADNPAFDNNAEITKRVIARPDSDIWDIELTVETLENITVQPIEVALVLDASGSMNYDVDGNTNPPAGTTTRLDILKEAAKDLIDKLYDAGPGVVSVSITKFNESAGSVQTMISLTDDSVVSAVKGKIDAMGTASWTNIAAGIDAGADTFVNNELPHSLIVLSDGEANRGGSDPAQAAIDAATTAKGEDIEVFAVGLCTNEAANDTLRSCASSGAGHFAMANNADDLNIAFQTIAANIMAMVYDTIGTGFDVPTVGDVTVLIDDVEDTTGTASIAGRQMMWTPAGPLEAGTKVVITYPVKLAAIPDPGDSVTGDGVFNDVDTNESARLHYSVGDGQPTDLNFPKPTVRFETGNVTVRVMVPKLDEWWNPVTDPDSGEIVYEQLKEETAGPVITDFLADGSYLSDDHITGVLPAYASFSSDDYMYEYTLDSIDIANEGMIGASGDALTEEDLKLASVYDGDSVDVGLPTGESELIYYYNVTPVPYTLRVSKGFTLSGVARTVPVGAKFDFFLVRVPVETALIPMLVTPVDPDDLTAAYIRANGEVVGRGSYTTDGNEVVGDGYMTYLTLRADLGASDPSDWPREVLESEVPAEYRYFLFEKNSPVPTNWKLDNTIMELVYGDDGPVWLDFETGEDARSILIDSEVETPLFVNNYTRTEGGTDPDSYRYKVVHEYYLVNADNTKTLEHSESKNYDTSATSVSPRSVAKEPVWNGRTYSFDTLSPDVDNASTTGNNLVITLTYTRTTSGGGDDGGTVITDNEPPLAPPPVVEVDIPQTPVPQTGVNSLGLFAALGMAAVGIVLSKRAINKKKAK